MIATLDRYSPLPHFTQRTRFLISVQLPLLEYYHDRISSSLDAFETFSSVFVRAVPGSLGVSLGREEEAGVNVDTKRLTSGVEGVQRLSKALVSAKFLGMAMEAWGEELVRTVLVHDVICRPLNMFWLHSSSSNFGPRLVTERLYGRGRRQTGHCPIQRPPRRTNRRVRSSKN